MRNPAAIRLRRCTTTATDGSDQPFPWPVPQPHLTVSWPHIGQAQLAAAPGGAQDAQTQELAKALQEAQHAMRDLDRERNEFKAMSV